MYMYLQYRTKRVVAALKKPDRISHVLSLGLQASVSVIYGLYCFESLISSIISV